MKIAQRVARARALKVEQLQARLQITEEQAIELLTKAHWVIDQAVELHQSVTI